MTLKLQKTLKHVKYQLNIPLKKNQAKRAVKKTARKKKSFDEWKSESG